MTRWMVRGCICFAADWLCASFIEYRSDGNWWHRCVGGWAQVAWFRAHNNRLYRWADR